MNYDTSQRAAITAACADTRLVIVTGGAGTGKTTLIKAITDTLEAKGQTVLLAAFAGKAAARLREATGHDAATIHRMLQYNGTRFMCEGLEHAVVIVDEASMVSAELMATLIRFHPKRLVLVGDPAQLPPVGRGQPFHDLIELRPGLVHVLTRCYRATAAVFHAATQIRNGQRPETFSEADGERWTMKNTGNAQQTHDEIMKWVAADMFDFEGDPTLNEKREATQLPDIILVARNGERDTDPCTVRGLNKSISELLLPRDEKTKFVIGDRVMNTKNLPDKDVWNGTTGTVHGIDYDGGIWVKTDTPVHENGGMTSLVLFAPDRKKHLQLAYAITTHKSQGSQFRRVLFAAFKRDIWGLLDRKLLYTAVTRTKEACCVVGEIGATWMAIERESRKRTVMQIVGGTTE